jgi:hypothetical protein
MDGTAPARPCRRSDQPVYGLIVLPVSSEHWQRRASYPGAAPAASRTISRSRSRRARASERQRYGSSRSPSRPGPLWLDGAPTAAVCSLAGMRIRRHSLNSRSTARPSAPSTTAAPAPGPGSMNARPSVAKRGQRRNSAPPDSIQRVLRPHQMVKDWRPGVSTSSSGTVLDGPRPVARPTSLRYRGKGGTCAAGVILQMRRTNCPTKLASAPVGGSER